MDNSALNVTLDLNDKGVWAYKAHTHMSGGGDCECRAVLSEDMVK